VIENPTDEENFKVSIEGTYMRAEHKNSSPFVAVLLPTYCEAKNIEYLIREIQELRLNLTIVVIDDSSPDGTADLTRKLQKKYGNINLFVRPEKSGLGTAISTGFKYVLSSLLKKPDYIVTMDADYSHNPKDIPRLIEMAEKGYDLVIGSRYCKGGKTIGWHWTRWLISHFANFMASKMIRTRIQDCTSGLRCYSLKYIKSVISSLHSQTYEIQIETIKQARNRGFSIKEIPITFANRKHGKSKLTKAEIRSFLFYIVRSLMRPVRS